MPTPFLLWWHTQKIIAQVDMCWFSQSHIAKSGSRHYRTPFYTQICSFKIIFARAKLLYLSISSWQNVCVCTQCLNHRIIKLNLYWHWRQFNWTINICEIVFFCSVWLCICVPRICVNSYGVTYDHRVCMQQLLYLHL